MLLTGRSTPPASAPILNSPSVSGGGSGSPPPEGPLEVSMLAPMHGPSVSVALAQLLREYRGWINEQIKASDTASVAVLYASAYGNTAALAQVRGPPLLSPPSSPGSVLPPQQRGRCGCCLSW